MSSFTKFPHTFGKKFPTKRTFRTFSIVKINGIARFCKLIYRTNLVESYAISQTDR